jgi:hypothetical protein
MNKGHLYLIVLVSFTFSVISCHQEKHNIAESKSRSFFDPMNLGKFNQTDNFTIHTSFTECGEWGGHEEDIKIYSDLNQFFTPTI